MSTTQRVAIDGVTAAGKTTLADELAEILRIDRPVERVSIDDYHRSNDERYARGRYLPHGYYLDAFDYPRFLSRVLIPLGIDRASALKNRLEGRHVEPNTILLVDGVFLLRPELAAGWDYKVFVDVDLEVAYERGIARDASWMGGEEEARRRYNARYIPGERMYLEEDDPKALADVVFENTDTAWPRLRTRD